MATWRHFARRTFPRVVLELGLPAASARPDLERCPKHDEPIDSLTNLCPSCFRQAWDEVGRRYFGVEHGADKSTERREAR